MEQVFAGCAVGRDYPHPIVEHATAYREAQRRLFALRSQPETRREAGAVQTRHGSRRKGGRAWR